MNSIFESLPREAQYCLEELEGLNETYEVMRPATLSPKLAAQGKKHRVRLWSVPRSTGELLYTQVLEQRPRVIVELGTSAGYSAIWLALAARQYGGKVITVDSSEEKIAMARQFAERAGVGESMTFLHGAIDAILEHWETDSNQEKIDMVFFDADKKNTLRFYELVRPHLAPEHTLIVDDAVKYAAAMQSFTSQIQNSADYASTLLEQDHGIFIAHCLPHSAH